MTSSPRSPRARLPLAPADRCWSCGAAIDAFQAVGQGGVCNRFECRAAEVRRWQAENREIEARRRDRARDRLEADGVDPGAASWSVTPFNPAKPVELAPERRADFLEYLRRTVEEAVGGGDGTAGDGGAGRRVEPPEMRNPARLDGDGDGDGDGRDDDGRFGPPEPSEERALAAGCATCRGRCCRQGGTHAFLTSERITRLLRERPELRPEDVPALYASYLRETHLEDGCVFQGETGCRLPREIRGDTCNDYFCPDLVEVRRLWRKAGSASSEEAVDTNETNRGGTHHFVAVNHRRTARAVGRTPLPEET